MASTATGTGRAGGDGASSRLQEFSLERSPRTRRARREVVGGLLMALVFALAAVLLHLRSVDQDPVLVLREPVGRGEVIAASDVGVAYLASDDPVVALGGAERAAVVGRVAAVDLPAGTILTRAQVVEVPTLRAGDGMVGLALESGQVPRSGLVPGDRVNVVAGPQSQGGPVTEPSVLVEAAAVVSVEELDAQGRRFVSLRMAEGDANAVAAAAERGPVRLVLVAR